MNRNSTVPSTPRIPRPAPFTPKKRPLSSSSSATTTSTSTTAPTPSDLTLTARLARTASASSNSSTNSLLSTTHKKYKAPLSVESRSSKAYLKSKSQSTLPPVPGTPTSSRPSSPSKPSSPTKRERTLSRPNTPGRGESPGGSLVRAGGEMDVSNVDVERVLVDWRTEMMEEGDVSADMDLDLDGEDAEAEGTAGEDKVMVSIRIRPTTAPSAWQASPTSPTLTLLPTYSKSPTPPVPYTFDHIHTSTPTKPLYLAAARPHVRAAMAGFNAVVFAYGQTASGKTYTLTGTPAEPGIIPRAMRDVFAVIKGERGREWLLRCSYLEIYNEGIVDLLAPPGGEGVQIHGGVGGAEVVLSPLREEVVTSLAGVREVLRRGEGNRRTACTDWNERSSRSHSVFRLVIESRERGDGPDTPDDEEEILKPVMDGRQTPGMGGRQTPGLGGRQTPGLGGPRLQARGGRSVRTSVLSLIDLAGSEKATSDKERTREGKYINTSLLTLGTVIGTLASNASKKKSDHVPYRNSKLTRLLQPSLAGNARISVVCTINPDVSALAESVSTLGFAKRIKNVQLNAQKKEVVDTDALIERYRKEIEDLKARLADREAEAPVRNRRLSAREQIDESKAMRDLNNRIQQLTKLILTSATVVDEADGDGEDGEGGGGGAGRGSPVKVDFDMSPYQLQQELLAARGQLESQANQILSLEAQAARLSRTRANTSSESDPEMETEKDATIAAQAETIRALEAALKMYQEGAGDEERMEKEEREREWRDRVEEEVRKREEGEKWAGELVRQLEKEKQTRITLEEERRALAAFVSKFDS
ncbi:P-loop containing nucleoside triphosphate hydrolase protein, partial [Crassisporium funariophilum]